MDFKARLGKTIKASFTLIIIAVILLIIFIYTILWLGFDYKFHASTSINFSDKFEAINALFSALAFAVLIVTMYFQKKELELQRQELENTREELKGQKEASQKQNEILQIQRFETTFFNQLEYFDRLTKSFSYSEERSKNIATMETEIREYYDYAAFTKAYYNINIGKNEISKSIDNASLFLHKLFAKDNYQLRFYFQKFIDIVEFVEKNSFESKDKYFYISIIRNKLTTQQLVLLLYYHIAYKKNTNPELLNRWVIFKNLSKVDIEISKDIYLEVVSEDAFNENGRYQ
ncbi:MAG: putative phage abortive infection protein [Bacteroidales bacterium]|jgi:uncharacterized membrane protein